MSERSSASPPARGPIGNTRSVPLSMVWFILTLGIYSFIWVYRTHKEIQEYSGEGVGGWLGFIIYFIFTWVGLAGVVTWFIIPSEIKTMMEAEGEESSVSGTTGPLVARQLADLRLVRLVHQGAGPAEPLLDLEGGAGTVEVHSRA